MFCPECGTEYQPGVTTCPECGAALVETRPSEARDEAEWQDLVPVLRTGDASLMMVAKSLLEAERIPFHMDGEGIQEQLGAGDAPGQELATGPGRLSVRPEDAEAARDLLAHLQPLEDDAEGPAS